MNQGKLFITTFDNRHYFCKRVLSIFLAKVMAAIIDFSALRYLYCTIRLVIGSENSHHPLGQSDLILKPTMFFQSVLHSLALIFSWMWFHDVLSKTL